MTGCKIKLLNKDLLGKVLATNVGERMIVIELINYFFVLKSNNPSG